MKTFVAVGRTSTPSSVISQIEEFCKLLNVKKYCMHTGGAKGADTFFADVYKNTFGGKVNVFLPWNGYNGIFLEDADEENYWIYSVVPKKAFELMKSIDPEWNSYWETTKVLNARNAQIYLDFWCDMPVDFIVYFDDMPEYIASGTQQGLKIAEQFNIPSFNLYESNALEKIKELLK